MAMINNDKKLEARNAIRVKLMQAIKDNSEENFVAAIDELMESVANDVRAEYEETRNETDARILAERGVRQLTSEERRFYDGVLKAMKSADPKQALSSAELTLPKTTIDAVFEELQTNHPLLSKINFRPSGGAVEIITSSNGYQRAVGGDLNAQIVAELLAGFAKVNAQLFKLTAFLPIVKAMLDLGPEWLDKFVRDVLAEALANGLEYGFVTGTGKNMPIGMDRQVGAGVTVVDGVYPKKVKITLNDLSPQSIGNLLGLMAVDAAGKPREIKDVIFLVNPTDYFTKIMPATTIMAPDGSFRNNVMPYPMEIIQTNALSSGDAIIGIAYRYLAVAGTGKNGKIEYSDHARFLDDERVYMIKAYANGLPMDNAAFLLLDISDLAPLAYKVIAVDDRTPSSDATIASLKIGALTLSPTFAAETTSYTATTTNGKNKIDVVPADAGASVVIMLNGEIVPNSSDLTWSSANSGVNTVVVTVTAEDGTTQKAYTVTVTKS